MILCCLTAVNLFKRLCQIVNRYYVWDFTYVVRNLDLDLPSVMMNGMIFVCFLQSHDSSNLKVSKLWSLLKATHWTFSRERSRKSKKHSKKILELAFSHFGLFEPFLPKRFTIGAQQGPKYVSLLVYNSFMTVASII